MVGADLVRAVALLLAVGEWILRGHIGVATLIGLTIVLSGGQAVFRPALQGMLAPLVQAPERLPAANALIDTTDRIARLLGPGLVALLAAILPPRHFFTLDAASFAASAIALLLIGRLRTLPPLRRAGPRQSLAAAVVRGFHAVAGHPVLRLEMWVSGAINGAWYAVMFLGLPLALARDPANGGGLGAFGLVIAAYGSTNLLATLFIGSRDQPANPGRSIFAGNLIVGLGLLLMSGAAAAPLPHGQRLLGLVLGAAFGAIGGPMHDIPVSVLRQTRLPRADVAAAMRASLVANNAGLLVTMLVVPAAYAALPVPLVMAACAVMIAAIGLVGFLRFSPGTAERAGTIGTPPLRPSA